MRILTLAALVLLPSACGPLATGPGAGNVEVRTDAAAYAPGGEITLEVINRGRSAVRHSGAAMAFLEVLEPDGWRQIGSIDCLWCVVAGPGLPFQLEPGETDSWRFRVDHNFDAGTQFRFGVLVEGRRGPADRRLVRTDVFAVPAGDGEPGQLAGTAALR